MKLRRNPAIALSLACLFLMAASPAKSEPTVVHTNQAYVEEATAKPSFDIADKMAVFSLVFGSLPAEVKVYPTENYYYFYFDYNGIKYAGNIRLDIADRDKGMIHFNYFKDFTQWQRDEDDYGALLGSKNGVSVKAVGKLAYDVAYNGRTVRFNLNDLSGVRPPKGIVGKSETYIGPVFDDSAIRFFLIFNKDVNGFLYLLDETVPVADQFDKVEGADRITVGIRTGFAFYEDRFAKRKVLVGVNQYNTEVNNYLDGPFDQLPDNFIEGETLRKAILAANPEMEGQIDRFGNSPDGETRYLIAPYPQYTDVSDLSTISQCAAEEKPPIYYDCFSSADSGEDEEEPAPDADVPAK